MCARVWVWVCVVVVVVVVVVVSGEWGTVRGCVRARARVCVRGVGATLN